jgi:hypothetical protein
MATFNLLTAISASAAPVVEISAVLVCRPWHLTRCPGHVSQELFDAAISLTSDAPVASKTNFARSWFA